MRPGKVFLLWIAHMTTNSVASACAGFVRPWKVCAGNPGIAGRRYVSCGICIYENSPVHVWNVGDCISRAMVVMVSKGSFRAAFPDNRGGIDYACLSGRGDFVEESRTKINRMLLKRKDG